MRLLNHLLSTNLLQRQEVEFYVAYTTMIFEFADIYEWSSVLGYDYHYRELQAEHNFKWGTFSPHMELQMLVPKRTKPVVTSAINQHHSVEDCRFSQPGGRVHLETIVVTDTLRCLC
ncbi:hypothetical protein DPMN_186762 [Dreissena polymorpha]|uniref:Uncharacterized protein n=1 Tax=Dreissena polymorpha TaxID=45954 RepID=A0A9D4DPP1_DREPO|nr:hypothetical protein DPMN_186762 [Dreissena polymorpha]